MVVLACSLVALCRLWLQLFLVAPFLGVCVSRACLLISRNRVFRHRQTPRKHTARKGSNRKRQKVTVFLDIQTGSLDCCNGSDGSHAAGSHVKVISATAGCAAAMAPGEYIHKSSLALRVCSVKGESTCLHLLRCCSMRMKLISAAQALLTFVTLLCTSCCMFSVAWHSRGVEGFCGVQCILHACWEFRQFFFHGDFSLQTRSGVAPARSS
jgi:hypothetical protein